MQLFSDFLEDGNDNGGDKENNNDGFWQLDILVFIDSYTFASPLQVSRTNNRTIVGFHLAFVFAVMMECNSHS